MNLSEYVKECENEGVDTWNSVMFLYGSALKKVETMLVILSDEFQFTHSYNPIEYIKSRIKKPNSITKKTEAWQS